MVNSLYLIRFLQKEKDCAVQSLLQLAIQLRLTHWRESSTYLIGTSKYHNINKMIKTEKK
jgi:hypothetical protein